MPSVRANGLDIGYDVTGAGPPLVLLHGATSSAAEDFAAQIPSMSKAFRLYMPDARGHGRTRWDAADGFSQAWLAADLAAFVDAVGLTTFHLLGFSMGAMTAMGYAARDSSRLRTLVIVGITPQREPRATIARRLMDPERIMRDDPVLGGPAVRTTRSGAGAGGLAAAAARHHDRDRQPAAAVAARAARHRCPDDGGLRRP